MRTDMEYQRRIDCLKKEERFWVRMSWFWGGAYVVFIAGLAVTAGVMVWATR